MPPTAPNEENVPTLDYLAPTLDSPRRSTSAGDSSSVPASPGTAADGLATAPYHRTVLPPPGPGALFGTYELIEKLGQGGMGIVYRARDLKLSREVALKVIRDGGFAEARQVERFYQEARAAAGLDHPNILPIFEIDQFGGLHFFTMKLAPAGSLHKNFKNYVGNARRSAELIEKVARAVHVAHAHGILHRDLKPGNILLEEEDSSEPLVADFGLAKFLGTEAVLTETGAPLGTPAYMAPEQAAGPSAQLTPASDVWSLGVILYELLTGVRPFQGNSSDEILSRIESGEPTPPRKLQPKLDRSLETICLKCLEREPSRRYQTADAVAEELRRWLAGEPIEARPVGRAQRVARWVWRRRRNVAVGLVMLSALGFLTVLAINHTRNDPPGEKHRDLLAGTASGNRRVEIRTQPPGADVVMVPMDELGRFQPEKALRPSGGRRWVPVTLADVPPGEYLVVANLPGFGFHEVYRTVPAEGGSVPGPYAHNKWEIVEGRVVLPTIVIPSIISMRVPHPVTFSGLVPVSSPLPLPWFVPPVEQMARFDGGEFTMGRANLPSMPAHKRSVAPFYLDTTEVTLGVYGRLMGRFPEPLREEFRKRPPNRGLAVTQVTYDDALACAELAGKRLPDEVEYEFAATGGGNQRFPWGDDKQDKIGWPPKPVGHRDVDAHWGDRTNTDPPVYGLYSNVGEWTSSCQLPYPGTIAASMPFPPPGMELQVSSSRVVRGAPYAGGKEEPDEWKWGLGPCLRQNFSRTFSCAWLGFRCARSARPRFLESSTGRIWLAPER